jgi:hypothetical protein
MSKSRPRPPSGPRPVELTLLEEKNPELKTAQSHSKTETKVEQILVIDEKKKEAIILATGCGASIWSCFYR